MRIIIDNDKMNIIGKNIRKARLKSGLTQKQLSDMLEIEAVYICRGSLSRIENNNRIVTDIEILGLSKVLKMPIEDFFIFETEN